MSILIIMLAAAILMSVSDWVEAAMIRRWKHTHYKRGYKRGWKLEGGWKL